METAITTELGPGVAPGVTAGWWACSGCATEAELPAAATAGCEVPCPDCGRGMVEQWCWDSAA